MVFTLYPMPKQLSVKAENQFSMTPEDGTQPSPRKSGNYLSYFLINIQMEIQVVEYEHLKEGSSQPLILKII